MRVAKNASEIIPQRSELDSDDVMPVRLICRNYVSAEHRSSITMRG